MPAQSIRTLFAVNDPEWRRWSNVDKGIDVRQRVSLREMTAVQRQAALRLVRASLSAKGFALAENIRKTDQTLLRRHGVAVRIVGSTIRPGAHRRRTSTAIIFLSTFPAVHGACHPERRRRG